MARNSEAWRIVVASGWTSRSARAPRLCHRPLRAFLLHRRIASIALQTHLYATFRTGCGPMFRRTAYPCGGIVKRIFRSVCLLVLLALTVAVQAAPTLQPDPQTTNPSA